MRDGERTRSQMWNILGYWILAPDVWHRQLLRSLIHCGRETEETESPEGR
jgi:hypothetical protein